MTIKKVLLLILSICLISSIKSQSIEKIITYKKNFFKQSLNYLSDDDFTSFWTIYKDHELRIFKLKTEKKSILELHSLNAEKMRNEEISVDLKRLLTIENEEYQMIVTLHQKLSSILSDKQVIAVMITEVKFRQYLIEELNRVAINQD